MVPINVIKDLMSLDVKGLEAILESSGYVDNNLSSAEFLGLNKQSDFVYLASWVDFDGPSSGQVFIVYDHKTGEITADF